MKELNKVKTAVVGCGMISNIYIKNFMNLFSIIDLTAVADINIESAKEKAATYNVPNVMTIQEVMESEEIELVVNLTPPFAHYDVIRRALNAGKHVFTEKMLCTDLAQGKELIQLAESKNLYLGVAPDTFLGAGVQTAGKIIESGLIGTVTSCSASLNRDQAMCSEKYGFIKKEGGSFPYDVGIYYVTALLSLLGPVKKIAGFTKPSPLHKGANLWAGNYGKEWELPGSNLVVGSLQFENGILGTLHFNGTSTNDVQSQLMIYGTEGILYMGNPGGFDGGVTLVRKGSGSCEIPFTHGYKGTPLYGEPTPYDWGGHRGLGAAEMAWSIRENRKNRASKELGLHTMEVFCGIDFASEHAEVYEMTTTFEKPRLLPSGYMAEELGGSMRADSEMSLAVTVE